MDDLQDVGPDTLAIGPEHVELAWRVAHRYLGDQERAEDAVQDAALAVMEGGLRPTRGGCGRSWFASVVLNHARNRRRGDGRRHRRELRPGAFDPAAGTAGPDARLEREDDVALVRRALADLPPDMAAVLLLHHGEGLSLERIASDLGRPVGTVASLASRGRARLRRRLAAPLLLLLAAPAMAPAAMPADLVDRIGTITVVPAGGSVLSLRGWILGPVLAAGVLVLAWTFATAAPETREPESAPAIGALSATAAVAAAAPPAARSGSADVPPAVWTSTVERTAMADPAGRRVDAPYLLFRRAAGTPARAVFIMPGQRIAADRGAQAAAPWTRAAAADDAVVLFTSPDPTGRGTTQVTCESIPRAIRQVANRLGVPAERCMLVGIDADADLVLGVAAEDPGAVSCVVAMGPALALGMDRAPAVMRLVLARGPDAQRHRWTDAIRTRWPSAEWIDGGMDGVEDRILASPVGAQDGRPGF
jgi:RNA polymerase sigma-70 factor (ECF subfamily)